MGLVVCACALAATTIVGGCTRTISPGDVCELVESYETGAPRDAYVACGEQGEELPCDDDVTGQPASTGAIKAAFAACFSRGSHPTSGIIFAREFCNGDSGPVVESIASGSCEVSSW